MSDAPNPTGDELPELKSHLRGTLANDPEVVWREVVLGLLAFKRFSTPQIARALGVAESCVQAVKDDPASRLTLVELSHQMPSARCVNAILADDADRNVAWLQKLRDGVVDGQALGVDARTLRVRADAAKTLLDRQVAKKVAIAVAPGRPVIDVTPEQVGLMRRLLDPPADESEGEVDG